MNKHSYMATVHLLHANGTPYRDVTIAEFYVPPKFVLFENRVYARQTDEADHDATYREENNVAHAKG